MEHVYGNWVLQFWVIVISYALIGWRIEVASRKARAERLAEARQRLERAWEKQRQAQAAKRAEEAARRHRDDPLRRWQEEVARIKREAPFRKWRDRRFLEMLAREWVSAPRRSGPSGLAGGDPTSVRASLPPEQKLLPPPSE
jgi:hypothetical protein